MNGEFVYTNIDEYVYMYNRNTSGFLIQFPVKQTVK